MEIKDKAIGILLIIAALGWWLFLKKPPVLSPEVIEKEVRVEVIKEVEVEKFRDVIRTIVRPDGTKETMELRESEKVLETSSSKGHEILEVRRSQAKYSLGMEVGKRLDKDLLVSQNKYLLTGGYRFSGPVWTTFSISNDRELMLGIRVEM